MRGYVSKGSDAVKRWRFKFKERMIDSMGGCCVICGYSKAQRALALHHIDPTQKELSFGELRKNSADWV